MKIAVLGTGSVGRTVAPALARLGHDVVIGTRDPGATQGREDWDVDLPLQEYAAAAKDADVVVNATNGQASLAALEAVGAALSGTVVVDLDLQFGDAGLALGLQPERTIYDLATSGGALDADKVDGYLAEHGSGVRVLLAPVRPDQAQSITVEFLKELYTTLTTAFDFVVVDTPPGFSPEVIATIDASSSICMIGMLDVFDASTASGSSMTRSSSAKTFALTVSSSTIASMVS